MKSLLKLHVTLFLGRPLLWLRFAGGGGGGGILCGFGGGGGGRGGGVCDEEHGCGRDGRGGKPHYVFRRRFLLVLFLILPIRVQGGLVQRVYAANL